MKIFNKEDLIINLGIMLAMVLTFIFIMLVCFVGVLMLFGYLIGSQ